MIDLTLVASRPLDGDCNVEGFCCGEDALDSWLRRRALKHHAAYRSRIVTYHQSGEMLGFYSLKLVLEKERDVRQHFDPRAWTTSARFPALHLEFLGVCAKHQKQGLGTFMLMEALDVFCIMAETTGVPAMTLTPLGPDLREYYEQRQFTSYGSNGGMLMTAQTAIELRDSVKL